MGKFLVVKCKKCGELMWADNSANGNGKYCSTECAVIDQL